MSDSLDLAPPVDEHIGRKENKLVSYRRLVARYMVNRARTALEDHTKADEILQNLNQMMLKQRQKAELAADLMCQPFTVAHTTHENGTDSYILSWNEGEQRFAILTVPLS